MKRFLLVSGLALALSGCSAPAPQAPASAAAGVRHVDLTHELSSDSIFWPTGETFRLDKVADGITPGGYYYASNNYLRAVAAVPVH